MNSKSTVGFYKEDSPSDRTFASVFVLEAAQEVFTKITNARVLCINPLTLETEWTNSIEEAYKFYNGGIE